MKRKLYPKRVFDILFSIAALIILWPFFIIIGLSVYINDGPPILFKQERPGLLGRRFILYKFRTMKSAFDCQNRLLSDKERLTSLGKTLRKTSLDELPELFNVIKGEMSLVGPRPLLMKYLNLYSREQTRRHEVLPGITGWAQVNGRNSITWEDRFKYDVWYVDHRNLLFDLKILWITLIKAVKRENVNQPGHATMEEFRRIGG